MTLNVARLLQSLAATGTAIPQLIGAVDEADARWKPPDGAWSILEIVRHLGDEEVDDFRARLRATLMDPEREWKPIDPEGWARERRYNEDGLAASVDRFVQQRQASLAWLKQLEQPAWEQAYQHPKFGPIAAGDLLAAWVAHDCLHVRQIAKRLFQLAERDAKPFNVGYAGEWT